MIGIEQIKVEEIDDVQNEFRINRQGSLMQRK